MFSLSFARSVDATPEELSAGWTEPSLMLEWFTPAPWRTTEAEVDARPGGIFRTVMEGPDGERNEGTGCVLAAEPGRRFVWTNVLGPGFAPNALGDGDFAFTATLTFEPDDGGCRYSARVDHADAAAMQQHEAMGFVEGWNAALDQLLEVLHRRR